MSYPLVAADLLALTVLVFGLFWHRDGRRELVVAYLTVNIGVLGVTMALSSATIGAGLGLGLFGVLSIIRLRSEELAQREIAYYFAALALGLLGGLAISPTWLGVALMAAIVAAVAIGDHPAVSPRTATSQIRLDRAYADPTALTAHVAQLLGTEVLGIDVVKLDLADDTTLVRVRHRAQITSPATQVVR
ncbi:DUF4956 domain-containing protein [Nocardioides sp. GY 10113]|uniref:DUF4956 domain-containing protein n=1 Tax=Nocardioides sp. GY 10113 TaxID=2569761 RepID=UPI0010A90100|nr:DUF4956 domain-containing protein [Nocardioides sp. GY 10113]TIC86329.1 DUF4956 domain-containing protein [Nocardioides sp. GY 10113]